MEACVEARNEGRQVEKEGKDDPDRGRAEQRPNSRSPWKPGRKSSSSSTPSTSSTSHNTLRARLPAESERPYRSEDYHHERHARLQVPPVRPSQPQVRDLLLPAADGRRDRSASRSSTSSSKGWNPAIEHTEPENAVDALLVHVEAADVRRDRSVDKILAEVEACHKANPDHHVRLIGYDNFAPEPGHGSSSSTVPATGKQSRRVRPGSPAVCTAAAGVRRASNAMQTRATSYQQMQR
ncbi:MAG: ribulose bisphosphate carboxylase small subunit [Chromatiales bacterium]|nr:ribulose bisphosphate carboxylase small subunit [Chromatiales bacterium]